MRKAPVVSVVIPAFNAAAFVGAAIESCQRQTLSDIEILVVYPADGYWRLKPLPPPALALPESLRAPKDQRSSSPDQS